MNIKKKIFVYGRKRQTKNLRQGKPMMGVHRS